MLSFPSTPTLRLPLKPFSQTTSLPSSPPPHYSALRRRLSLLSAASSTYSPAHHHPNPNHQQPPQSDEYEYEDDDEDHAIGDCLVFDDGAFEDGDPFLRPDPGRQSKPPRRRRNRSAAASSSSAAAAESLVPEKWKEAVERMNMTKKEKRKIAYQLNFGSKMDRRKNPSVPPDVEEYRVYRAMKMSQLNPIVLDDPQVLSDDDYEEAADFPETEGPSRAARVAPRNPRLGYGGGSLEEISDFFNSGGYMPEDINDEKKKEGKRKLFTKEEKVLLNKRIPNIAEAGSRKWLPLHTLAASGEFFMLDILLKHNVDINDVDEDGLSGVHRSLICKKQAIFNYLLRNSANPFVRDKDGATLMHYAVETASTQAIKILLLYNVDINLPDNDGWTPLHLAVQTRRTDIVRLLLIKGADRTLKNMDGLTPLDLCLYSGHDTRTFELIKLLKVIPRSKLNS